MVNARWQMLQARRAVIDHSAKLLREDNAMDLNYIVLDLPCTFFMLRSLRWAGDARGQPRLHAAAELSAFAWSCSAGRSSGSCHVKMVSPTPETPQTWLRSNLRVVRPVSSNPETLNPWLRSNLRVVTEVARSLEFAPAIERMAERIVDKIAKSAHGFNAVHLRIEKDARDWSQIMGGPEVHKAVEFCMLRGCLHGAVVPCSAVSVARTCTTRWPSLGADIGGRHMTSEVRSGPLNA
jgi:hypothetical protein